jgi:hypothetical protein
MRGQGPEMMRQPESECVRWLAEAAHWPCLGMARPVAPPLGSPKISILMRGDPFDQRAWLGLRPSSSMGNRTRERGHARHLVQPESQERGPRQPSPAHLSALDLPAIPVISLPREEQSRLARRTAHGESR